MGWHNGISALLFPLVSIVSSKKSAGGSSLALLKVICHFFSMCFNILSLHLVFKIVSMLSFCVHVKLFILHVYPASIDFYVSTVLEILAILFSNFLLSYSLSLFYWNYHTFLLDLLSAFPMSATFPPIFLTFCIFLNFFMYSLFFFTNSTSD